MRFIVRLKRGMIMRRGVTTMLAWINSKAHRGCGALWAESRLNCRAYRQLQRIHCSMSVDVMLHEEKRILAIESSEHMHSHSRYNPPLGICAKTSS